MSKQKKTNIISLLTYRNKKKKLKLKKTSKAASDKDVFFTDHEKPSDSDLKDFKDGKGVKEGKIYYMSNYWKTKHNTPLEEQSHSEEKREDLLEKKPLQNSQKKYKKIINLSQYRNKNQTVSKSFNKNKSSFFKGSKVISIEDYRKNKSLQFEGKERTKSRPFPKRAVKEAVSFSAMALMMLFALNIFFPNDESFDKQTSLYASESVEKQNDTSAEVGRGIASLGKGSGNKKIRRSLSSFFKEKDNFSSTKYIQKIQNEEFKDQKVIVGKKPNSSTYEGF